MSLSPTPTCPVCSTKAASKCTACKVTVYCGREHQASDRPAHRRACNGIKRAQATLASCEAELRALPGDQFVPSGEEIFSENEGHFWNLRETRPYMRARYALIEALLEVKTRTAVEEALFHAWGMMRLCYDDYLGARNVVPGMLLRLGRDQRCYDFVKCWGVASELEVYGWTDRNEPYIHMNGEDVFEPLGFICPQGISHTLSIILVKIRVLIDLLALKGAALIGHKVPPEILDNICSQMVGYIVFKRKDIMKGENLDSMIEKLEGDVLRMYLDVEMSNRHFWPALLRPGLNLSVRPKVFSPGGVEEMQLGLQHTYDAWAESPGAIDYISKLRKSRSM